MIKTKLLLSNDDLDILQHTFLYVKSLNDYYNQLLDNPTEQNELFFKNFSISLAIFGNYNKFSEMYHRLSTLNNLRKIETN